MKPDRIGDRQRARYVSTRPGRNRGPKGRMFLNRPWRTTHHVEVNIGGERLAMTMPLHSRRACKRALQRLRRRYPDAYGVTYKGKCG